MINPNTTIIALRIKNSKPNRALLYRSQSVALIYELRSVHISLSVCPIYLCLRVQQRVTHAKPLHPPRINSQRLFHPPNPPPSYSTSYSTLFYTTLRLPPFPASSILSVTTIHQDASGSPKKGKRRLERGGERGRGWSKRRRRKRRRMRN